MNKNAKKIISAVLFVGMLSGVQVPTMAEEDTAKLEFTSSNVAYTNVDWVTCNTGSITEIGGRAALQLKSHDESNLYLRVGLSDKWLYAPDGTSVEFDVEYYDTGAGSFAIAYDSTNNNNVGSKDTDVVYMTGDNKWKKTTLYVSDIRAMNSFEGGDFRLALWSETMGFSEGDIYIGSIEIRKVFPRHPVDIKIETPYYGNIFGGEENKAFDVILRDLTDEKMDTEISYTVTDEDGQIVKRGNIQEDPEAVYETVKLELDDFTKYGVYDLDITAVSQIDFDGEIKEYISTASASFSVINKSEIGETNWRYGACTHSMVGWWPSEGTAEIARWAGIGSVRDEAYWNDIEKSPGKYEMTESGQKYIDSLRENGLQLLYITNGGNSLYPDEGGFIQTAVPKNEKALKAHAEFCAWMTKEYNDVLAGIEIWNEPNTENSNANCADGAAYSAYLHAAYAGIKGADKNMKVLAPGFEPGYPDWAESTFPTKSYESTDIFVTHPYNWDTNKFIPEDYVARFDNVKKSDAEYGVNDRPRWFTEFGFTSADNDSKVFAGSQRQQAQTVIKEYVTGLAEGLFERTYWYDLYSDGVETDNVEHNFGLVRHFNDYGTPSAAKPAYVAMAGMNKLMANAEYVDKIYVNKQYYAFRFKKNGEDIAVLWANEGNEQAVSFDFGTDSVEMLDKYTNSDGKLYGRNGVFSFTLGEDPIYIKGNFSKFEKTDADLSQSVVVADVLPNDMFSFEVTDNKARNLNIVTDAPAGVMAEVGDMENGKAKITLKTEKKIPENMFVKISAYDGNNKVFSSYAELRAAEPINVNISVSQVEKDNPDQWQAEVKIVNNSYTEAVSGICQILSIDGEETATRPISFNNLKSGETVTLFLNLDTMVKKRNVDLKVKTTLDYGYECDNTESVDFTNAICYASNKPVIDGKLGFGEWKSSWMTGDKATRVKNIINWGGPDDLSFDCNLMWDEEKLYVAANVKDDVFCNNETPGNMWKGDMFQFAIEDKIHNGDYTLVGGGLDTNFTEFGAALLNNSAPTLYRFSSEYNKCENGVVENAEIAVKRENAHIIYEIAIPWTEIFGADYEFDRNKIFGFSMLANDNDGNGRRGWIEYNSGIGMYKDGLLFGKITLTEK